MALMLNYTIPKQNSLSQSSETSTSSFNPSCVLRSDTRIIRFLATSATPNGTLRDPVFAAHVRDLEV